MPGINWTRCNAACSPTISSPCRRVGAGVEEIRIRDDSGAFRIIYTARIADSVYVLHAFQKKTQATPKRVIDMAKARYRELTSEHKGTSGK